MASDLLAGAAWSCAATPPGLAADPEALRGLNLYWWPAIVPGTAAGALVAAGDTGMDVRDFDTEDWWFRCEFPGDGATPMLLTLGGLATVADVWLNGLHVCHSENMFLAHELPVEVAAQNELVIRCAALRPLLAPSRRPRARWRSPIVPEQNLRWWRTSLLGRIPGWGARIPAPVGPWKPVRLVPDAPGRLTSRRIVATLAGADGVLSCEFRLRGGGAPVRSAFVEIGDHRLPLEVTPDGADLLITGCHTLPGVEAWWPHTHGQPTLHRLALDVGERRFDLGNVGFRSVVLTDGDGPTLVVNDVVIFARGAVWEPPDPVGLSAAAETVRATLELARAAGMNLVRVPGNTCYADETFFDACDELGILVWQDCMLAYLDPPDDPAFGDLLEQELRQQLAAWSGHASVAVVCGGQEHEEQAAMSGAPAAAATLPLLTGHVAGLVAEILPGTSYVANNPSGGNLSFQPDTGTSHYFGVGQFRRRTEELRRDRVRFALECLAFAIPPKRETVDEVCGGPRNAGFEASWKLAIHHDNGTSWDLEDIRDVYVRQLFGVDPLEERSRDPERALDLGRAAVSEVMTRCFAEWRRPGSDCAAALILAFRDLRPGAGWGVIDTLGRPKAPYYALARALTPVAVSVCDEGLNGLRITITNDSAAALETELRAELVLGGELRVPGGTRALLVEPRSATTVGLDSLLGAFRDPGYVYRFGPPTIDAIVVSLVSADDGRTLAEVIHLPLGIARDREHDIGLSAALGTDPLQVTVTTRRLAEFVVIDVPGHVAEDSWFHLPPGGSRTVALRPTREGVVPEGEVRALNSVRSAHLAPAG